MQFPNTLLQNFLKSYSSLDSSGLITSLDFVILIYHYFFYSHSSTLHNLNWHRVPHLSCTSSFCHSLGSQHIWGSLTSEYLFHFGNIIHVWVTAVFIVFENFICAYLHHIALEIMSLPTCILILMYLLNFEKAVDQVFKLH